MAAELGEGPVWVGRDAALWYVDIKGRRLHRFDPQTGSQRSWDAPDKMPVRDGAFERHMLAGLKTGFK